MEPKFFSPQVSEARRFYLEVDPAARPARDGVSVICGGWERCLPEYDLERSGFFCPIIEFISRGAGTVRLDGREHPLRPGTVFAYGRGIAHRIRASREVGLTKYFVAVTGEAARDLLKECQILPGGVRQVMHPEQVGQVFDDLIRHGLGDHPKRGRMCGVALQYLVLKIADLAVPPGSDGSAAVATYQRCRQYIEEHYHAVRSLREVAAACRVDSAYLCRLFKKFRRQTPFQYLQTLQMNRAVDLLQSGNRSVKETAQELGFPDPYNFSRAFKRVFGISPQKLGNDGRSPAPPTDPAI